MTRTEHEMRHQRIRDAYADLIRDPRFGVVMELFREYREEAVRYMVDHTTAKDEREWLCAVGEVRCYDRLLDAYQSAIDQQQEQLNQGG